MKISTLLTFFIGILLLISCRSEFEKIRTSNDAQSIYNKAVEYYQNEDYARSLELISIVLNSYRGKKEFEDLNYMLANANYQMNNFELASSYFKNFANGFLNSHRREESDFMSAYSLYRISPTYRLDQGNTLKAIDAFQLFVNSYPNSARIPECNRLMDEMRSKLEEKAFNEAYLYYNIRQYQSAIHSFENLLKDFPETKRVEEIRYYIIKSAYDFAVNSIFEKRAERLDETIDRCDEFLAKYKQGERPKEVRNILNTCRKNIKTYKDDRYQIESTGN
jgi:outer membrane protein assembly factor BamD